jgi:hypothetical protein
MCHSIPLAPITEMCLEYMEALNDKNTKILGLYEGYLKFNLAE